MSPSWKVIEDEEGFDLGGSRRTAGRRVESGTHGAFSHSPPSVGASVDSRGVSRLIRGALTPSAEVGAGKEQRAFLF